MGRCGGLRPAAPAGVADRPGGRPALRHSGDGRPSGDHPTADRARGRRHARELPSGHPERRPLRATALGPALHGRLEAMIWPLLTAFQLVAAAPSSVAALQRNERVRRAIIGGACVALAILLGLAAGAIGKTQDSIGLAIAVALPIIWWWAPATGVITLLGCSAVMEQF